MKAKGGEVAEGGGREVAEGGGEDEEVQLSCINSRFLEYRALPKMAKREARDLSGRRALSTRCIGRALSVGRSSEW